MNKPFKPRTRIGRRVGVCHQDRHHSSNEQPEVGVQIIIRRNWNQNPKSNQVSIISRELAMRVLMMLAFLLSAGGCEAGRRSSQTCGQR